MSVTTTLQITSAATAESDAFDRAVQLVADELGGVVVPSTTTAHSVEPGQVRERKLALTLAVSRSLHIRSITEAFRVVDAAYPFFSVDEKCTEEAVTAACDPLYGGLAQYRLSTQRMLRTEARGILTRAIALVSGEKI